MLKIMKYNRYNILISTKEIIYLEIKLYAFNFFNLKCKLLLIPT